MQLFYPILSVENNPKVTEGNPGNACMIICDKGQSNQYVTSLFTLRRFLAMDQVLLKAQETFTSIL